jgi:hypothetical protein
MPLRDTLRSSGTTIIAKLTAVRPTVVDGDGSHFVDNAFNERALGSITQARSTLGYQCGL